MVKKILFFFISSLFVFVATVFFRLGGHKDVTVQVKKYPALYFLYQEKLGPYHEIELSIEQVENWAHDNHLPCSQTFGEFLDDARTTDERRLRSHVGCVISAPLDDSTLAKLKNQSQFIYEVRPEHDYVWAQFDGAPSIGPLKVYPKIRDFLEKRGFKSFLPSLEIYTIQGSRVLTEYLTSLPN
jgi:effector-binding domain-containing protein